MTSFTFPTVLLPETILALWVCLVLLAGAFAVRAASHSVAFKLSVAGLVGVLGLMSMVPLVSGPSFLVQATPLAFVGKLGVYATTLLALLISPPWLRQARLFKMEYPVLLLLMALGAGVMLSASHVLTLYIGLELMSFSLYILTAFSHMTPQTAGEHAHNARSSEAALKYFVLGSLASGLVLFGASLVYAQTGTLAFAPLAQSLQAAAATGVAPLTFFAVVLLLSGFVFKLSLVPLHVWTADVYEGAPTPVTALMSSAPKIAVMSVLLIVLTTALAALLPTLVLLFAVFAAGSMVLGSALAVVQHNIKRLLAFSAIAHMGFAACALVALPGVEAVTAALFYVLTYGLVSLGAFAVLMLLPGETAEDLKGLGTRAPFVAAAMLVFLFSLAGLPPFVGFFAKFVVFQQALQAGFGWLVLVGVVASLVAVGYALKLLKEMYFSPATTRLRVEFSPLHSGLILALAAAVVGLGLFPGLLLQPLAGVF